MGKNDLQDSANKVKEGAKDLKNKAADKIDDFKASTLNNKDYSSALLWGSAGATAGAITSLVLFKNASLATRLATIGGAAGGGAYFGNRFAHRPARMTKPKP